MNEECIFCKIVEGSIPSTKVYEDDDFLAFVDIFPIIKGHVLLVPKEHHAWMQEASDEIVSKAFLNAKKIMIAMKKGLGCEFVQLSVVGKEVKHFHIHLMPRDIEGDIDITTKVKYDSDEEKYEYADKIKNAL
jgi:histidine triad (HIT) family protein